MNNCFNCKWHEVVEVGANKVKYNACMIHGAHQHHVDMCPHVACEDWEENEDEK